MSRNYANVLTEIWRDPSFRSCPALSQRALLLLFTQPDISAAGTLALTVRRWADMAPDSDRDGFEAALRDLEDRGFALIDWDSEELMLRPFIRWDGGYSNSKRRHVIIEAAQAVVSHAIGWALTCEFKALDLPLAGLPDAPPDSPSQAVPLGLDATPDALYQGLSDDPPDTAPDTAPASERVVVVTEVDVAGQPTTRNPQPVASRASPLSSDRFDEFYAAYPRRVGRGAARKAWLSALRRKVDADRAIAAARVFAEKCQRERVDPKFIPHPSTWLNAERYDDQPDPPPQRPAYWTEAASHAG